VNFDLVAASGSPEKSKLQNAQTQFGERLAKVIAARDDPREHPLVPPGLGHKIDRFAALALAAVLPLRSRIPREVASERVGVYVANALAGWSYGEEQLQRLVANGPEHVHAFQATAWFPAAAQGEITIATGITGPAKTFSGRSSAFGEAMLAGVTALTYGRVDAALVGAAECCTSAYLRWSSGLHTGSGLAEGAFFILLTRKGLTARAATFVLALEDRTDSPPSALPMPSTLPPQTLEAGFEALTRESIPLRLPVGVRRCIRIHRLPDPSE
jgi:hypothetical protein